MTADNPNDFPYRPAEEPSDAATRKRYWATAMGLQNVDGLEPSCYLRSLAEQNTAGELSLQDTAELIRAYHDREGEGSSESPSTREADLVSQRIVEMLASRAFLFAPTCSASSTPRCFATSIPRRTARAGTSAKRS